MSTAVAEVEERSANDSLTVLRCDKCPAIDTCPKAELDRYCWYESSERVPDLKTATSILVALREKVGLDYVRYQRAMRLNTTSGHLGVDRNMTTLSNTITRDLLALTELSVRFGFIDERGAKQPDRITTIRADNVNVLQITSEELNKCKDLQRELDILRKQREAVTILPLPRKQ